MFSSSSDGFGIKSSGTFALKLSSNHSGFSLSHRAQFFKVRSSMSASNATSEKERADGRERRVDHTLS